MSFLMLYLLVSAAFASAYVSLGWGYWKHRGDRR